MVGARGFEPPIQVSRCGKVFLLSLVAAARSSTSHETFAIIEPLLYAGRPVNVSNPPWTCLTCNLAVVNIVHILVRIAHWWRDIRITHRVVNIVRIRTRFDIHDTAVIRRIRITNILTRIDHRIVHRIVRRIRITNILRAIYICLATRRARRAIAQKALRLRYRRDKKYD